MLFSLRPVDLWDLTPEQLVSCWDTVEARRKR